MPRLAIVVALLGLSACDTSSSEAPDFGFDYAVAPSSVSLDGGVLRATLSYSGGCEDHTFRAESRRVGEGAEVWIVHGGTPDPCEAYLTETVTLAVGVADDVIPVRLLLPTGDDLLLRAHR